MCVCVCVCMCTCECVCACVCVLPLHYSCTSSPLKLKVFGLQRDKLEQLKERAKEVEVGTQGCHSNHSPDNIMVGCHGIHSLALYGAYTVHPFTGQCGQIEVVCPDIIIIIYK